MYKDFVGIPYENMSCWDLIDQYHKLETPLPRVPLSDILAMGRQREELKKRFTQVDYPKDGDIVLHGTHVGIWVNDGIDKGILHSVVPRSEFVPLQIPDLNATGFMYKKPTYWRVNK